MEMKYVREPGYVYDLFFVYTLHFNKENYLEDIINRDHSTAEKKYFDAVLEYFCDFSESLYPFFYLKNGAQSFITQHYFYDFESSFSDSYSFETVHKALVDVESVKQKLLSFYFDNLNVNHLSDYLESTSKLGELIQNSNYSDRLKCGLFGFFMNPMSILQTLIHSLLVVEVKLSKYYGDHYEKILDFQKNISGKNLDALFAALDNHKVSFDEYENVHYSIPIVMKNCIQTRYVNNGIMLMLGWDFESILERVTNQDNIELDVLGTALSEANRVEIFELMYKSGEITIKDIEQTMKISGTNAYYHLMLMLKANIVQTRNQGRTICYSINKNQIDLICKYLSRFGNKFAEVN